MKGLKEEAKADSERTESKQDKHETETEGDCVRN